MTSKEEEENVPLLILHQAFLIICFCKVRVWAVWERCFVCSMLVMLRRAPLPPRVASRTRCKHTREVLSRPLHQLHSVERTTHMEIFFFCCLPVEWTTGYSEPSREEEQGPSTMGGYNQQSATPTEGPHPTTPAPSSQISNLQNLASPGNQGSMSKA